MLRMVPVIAKVFQKVGDQPAPGIEEEDPQHRGNGRSNGIRQQHQRLVNPTAAHHVIHQSGKNSDTRRPLKVTSALKRIVVQKASR